MPPDEEDRPGDPTTTRATHFQPIDDQPATKQTSADRHPSGPCGQPGDVISAYPEAKDIYRGLGWLSVLPLTRGTKWPPPSGFTGGYDNDPTPQDYAGWAVEFPHGNVCIRLPDVIVGIDVDAYGDKTGAQTLAEAEKRWVPLPPSYRATSRKDGVSGIRLFRVPAGTKLRSVLRFRELGIGDIEIIQRGHRYVVAWPSVHDKTGLMYRWLDEAAGLVVMDTPPGPDDPPFLPEAWIEGLRVELSHNGSGPGRNTKDKREKSQNSYDVTEAMTVGKPSYKVVMRLAEALADLAQGLNRHDTMCGHVLALLRYGQRGEPGVEMALETLFHRFVDTVGEDRVHGEREAEAEFARMVTNAEALLADSPPQQPFVWPDPKPKFGTSRTTDPRADNRWQPDANQRAAETAFWEQRPIFAHIHRFARSRRTNPYAVLGSVLRRAITLVPPHVQLPATVGTATSINLLTTNVGRSGEGKDIANGVGRDAVVFLNLDRTILEDPVSPGIGTGEGLARLFKGYGSGDGLAETRVHLEVNEVGTLEALAARKGGTLVGELLKAFMGQSLGFSNAQKATTTFIRAQTYRLCLGVGAQPENTDFFLSREKDGLPQRFLWLPIVNPYALPPPDDDHQEHVPAVEVTIPEFTPFIEGAPYLITVPKSVKKEIRDFHYQVEIGSADVNPLDGHLMLVRLKVAFGLALLETRGDISEADWRIAGQLMDVSNRVRADSCRVVADRHRRTNTARAHDQADREALVAEKLSEKNQQRVVKAITRKLSRVGSATRRELHQACDSSISRDFPAVFDLMADQGLLVAEDGKDDVTRVTRYRLASA